MKHDMTFYERAIERVLATNPAAEARAWIHDQSSGPRRIWEFGRDESIYIVETAYARGAEEVLAVGEDVLKKYGSVDMLILRLPKDVSLRSQLFDLEDAVAQESGFEGSVDEGQDHILLRWT